MIKVFEVGEKVDLILYGTTLVTGIVREVKGPGWFSSRKYAVEYGVAVLPILQSRPSEYRIVWVTEKRMIKLIK